MKEKILDALKGLVFEGAISLHTGRVFEFIVLNSRVSSHHMGKLVCELSLEQIAKEFKLKDPALRFHTRQLEKKGFMVTSYLFKVDGCDVHVDGHKNALQMGIRGIKEVYFTILPENILGGKR